MAIGTNKKGNKVLNMAKATNRINLKYYFPKGIK
jgi:hypothetical protein